MGFIWRKRQFEDKTVAWMGTVVNTKGVVVVEERNGNIIFGDGQDTRVMLPCLQGKFSSELLGWEIGNHLLTKCPFGGRAPKSPPVSPWRVHSMSPFAETR